jgi:hypothetical protein
MSLTEALPLWPFPCSTLDALVCRPEVQIMEFAMGKGDAYHERMKAVWG